MRCEKRASTHGQAAALPRDLSFTWLAFLGVAISAMLALLPLKAHAVPSFARQTGLACEACHTVFPELTPYGRIFKLYGYVFSNVKNLSDIDAQRSSTLSFTEIPPISVMLEISDTHINKNLPDLNLPSGFSQNDTVEFPQQASIFYAGKIAPNFGTFFQLTFDPSANSIGIDNTDLRFADGGKYWNRDLIYGISLNNNPTSQDVWNSTPAWGFPFITFNASPSPAASAMIDGGLGQQTAGATAYLMVNRQFYGEFGAYRSAKIGFTNNTLQAPGPLDSTVDNVIDGLAPYWRFAWEHAWGKNTLELGTFGLYTNIKPGGTATAPVSITSGPSDQFTDIAFDTQYQYIGEDNIFTLTGTWIHESADRHATAASHAHDGLDTVRATGTYFYKRRYGGSLELFQTTGDRDTTIFTPAQVTGSRNGLPDTRGATIELDYVPWLNTKIGIQYTAYLKFNGATSNYDSFGRNASDNNTLFLFLWTAF